jgi:hypothetical protein
VELEKVWLTPRRTALRAEASYQAVGSWRPYNKSLVLTAKAAFNYLECLVVAGLAGQVGVKSKCVCWWRGVFIYCITFDSALLRAAAQLNR